MSDLLEVLRSGLEGQYDVERELGRGGMSTVFLARDLKHDRRVALKVLRPDLASVVGSERFLQEIKLTASLNHPHILPLLDSGAIGDLVYYVMPFVTGGSLRGRLDPSAPMDPDDAMRLTRQVAAALDYAHRAGVVHRDIKPENILFSEGLAVVADFGVAKAVSTVDRQTLTRSGFPVGTLGYMSPEQAAGRTNLDERTDVFSLACVAYEMLVGDTPAGWPSPEDSRLGRFMEAPDEHRMVLDQLPGRVEQCLARALALRAADRFRSPGEFVAALSSAAAGRDPIPDEEMRAILARASELEVERAGRIEQGDQALTMGSVEQVAAEVGIPPAHVRAAAAEVRGASEVENEIVRRIATEPALPIRRRSLVFPRAPDVSFAKERLTAERAVEGEISEAAYPEVVDIIQDELDLVGHVSTVGRTLTWSPARQGTESRQIVVTVRPRDGVTDLHIEEQIELAGWRIFAPGWGAGAGAIFGLAMAAMLGMQEEAILVLALPSAIFGAIATVKGMINTKAQNASPQLQRVLDRLTALVKRRPAENLLSPEE
ncbi:MAG: serine/threonine protein kinase [Gemmatimonadetes bacterium]|nr:serine/threonine protein kinase [Gemmatimonadota bacterium]